MRKNSLILTTLFAILAIGLSAQPGDVPPNSEPGKCYAKCLIADEYETITEEVQTKGASSRTVVVPAQYETVTEEVLVKEASSRIVTVPAQYETVTEEVLASEGSSVVQAVPARFEDSY